MDRVALPERDRERRRRRGSGESQFADVFLHMFILRLRGIQGKVLGGCLLKSGALGMSQDWGKIEAHQHEDLLQTKRRNTGKKEEA